MSPSLFGRAIAAILALAFAGAGMALAEQPARQLSLEELRQQRRELARRPRRIIMNNDGCDVVYFPKGEQATVENFLAKRTTPLAGTQVDAIAFCPTSSGFSYFTHDTKVGTVLSRSGEEFGIQPNTRNIAKELIDQGTDCLQAVIQFGHKHDMEVLLVDAHERHARRRPPARQAVLPLPAAQVRASRLAGGQSDPADAVRPLEFGRLCAAGDPRAGLSLHRGSLPQLRCRRRRARFLPPPLLLQKHGVRRRSQRGGTGDDDRPDAPRANDDGRSGRERGRPILIAARMPDSTGFCRDMGFDIERWLQEGLVDMLITTCYFQLNPWEYSVELGHKYGVPVYPCLSDSRVVGETRFRRSSAASYRGRAMNAWAAGADGLHMFNFFDPNAQIWREIGDPKSLLAMDKLYFVNVRDGDPRRYLARGLEYRTLSDFGPSQPRLITPSKPVTLEINIGDDLSAAQSLGQKPSVQLHVEAPGVQRAEQLRVKLNGVELAGGVLNEGWVDYPAPQTAVRRGVNQVEVA